MDISHLAVVGSIKVIAMIMRVIVAIRSHQEDQVCDVMHQENGTGNEVRLKIYVQVSMIHTYIYFRNKRF